MSDEKKPVVEVGTIIDPTYTSVTFALTTAKPGNHDFPSKIPDLGYNLLVMKTYQDGKWEVVEISKKTGKPKGQDENSLEVTKGIRVMEIRQEWLRNVSILHLCYACLFLD